MRVATVQDAIARYGAIDENDHWADEAKWMVMVEAPAELQATVINSITGQPLKHIYCNKDMAEALTAALQNIVDRGLIDQFKTFDGCFYIRNVRGDPDAVSTHSYGLAIDINASTNAMSTQGDMSDELAACFTDAGFTWGKVFHRPDPMHMSQAWEL